MRKQISGRYKWRVNRIKWWFNEHYKWIFKKPLLTFKKQYGGYPYIRQEEGNVWLREQIESGTPFACCRYGIGEVNYLTQFEEAKFGGDIYFKDKEEANYIFRIDDTDQYEGLRRFSELMKDAAENADFVGVWKGPRMADWYISTLNLKGKLGSPLMVEPYYFDIPWSKALKGKRVLVINPFVETIRKQYAQKDKLFKNEEVLPEFELITLDSVWYDTSFKDRRFSNWFEAYDYLYNEAMKLEFDIALLGCGPFGFPLATRFKNAGKQAIHIGGALQILFGIKGQRWDANQEVNCFYNDYWVRPEMPQQKLDMRGLDNGCYW